MTKINEFETGSHFSGSTLGGGIFDQPEPPLNAVKAVVNAIHAGRKADALLLQNANTGLQLADLRNQAIELGVRSLEAGVNELSQIVCFVGHARHYRTSAGLRGRKFMIHGPGLIAEDLPEMLPRVLRELVEQ